MKKNLFILLLICWLGFLTGSAFSQTPRFRQLSVNEGLTGNAITVICQDQKGFIWIGGQTGLCRFDGLNIKTFRHRSNDSTSLPADDVVCLHADNDQSLWVGTRSGGMCKIDLATNKITRFKPDRKGNGHLNAYGVLCITEGKSNQLYIGTDEGGLNILDRKTGKFTYLLQDPKDTNSLASNNIRCMAIDKHGKWWMGHVNDGLSCYNPVTKKFKRFHSHQKDLNSRLSGNTVRAVFCDSRNRIWISTWSAGVNIYDQHNGQLYEGRASEAEEKKDASHDRTRFGVLKNAGLVYAMTEDHYGNVWLACLESGLVSYNIQTGKLRQFKNMLSNPYSICDNNLLSVYVDRSGLVWAGSLSSGISIFNPYTDRMGYCMGDGSQPGQMQNSQVWSVHRSRHTHRLFIGTLGHVYVLDPQQYRFTEYVTDEKGNSILEPQAIVQTLFEDAKGRLWVSVNGAGIHVYDPTTRKIKIYHTDKARGSLVNASANYMYEDKSGRIWIGVPDGGLELYAPESDTFVHHYYDNTPGCLSAYVVNHITEDKAQNLWIATDSGVNMLPHEKNTFTVYKAGKSGLSANLVYSVYCDQNGTVWAGTQRGICRFDTDKKTFTNVSEKLGWGETAVIGITGDASGNLWLLTEKGMTVYRPANGYCKNYDFSDGLQSNEFPANAIATAEGDYIVAGGARGLNCFKPTQLITNRNIPAVSLTKFSLRNQEIDFGNDIAFTKTIELDYNHYFFTLEFASLDFTNVARNKYKYRLEGFNNDWVDLGNKQQVTFVNLDPGEYVFRIAASNNDGAWNMKGATLNIVVTPPFWKTKWFYTLCIIFGVGCIYFFIKFRERKLKKEKQVLEEKVTERTNELREEKEKVEEAHKEIKDSIYYAQRIQTAIIPSPADFRDMLPESFVLFQPKDVVSGDFYWITQVSSNEVLYAAADCTGHGVPGGFMSMLGTSFLNEIVNEKKITGPALILNLLREKVISALKQSGAAGENKDGMDITLIKLNTDTNKIVFAGANNPVWIVRKNECIELKPDKQPVGFYLAQKHFTQQEIDLQKGDMIYSFTDGYADQFGGPKGKKFKYSTLQQLLISVSQLPIEAQYQKVREQFEQWKGNTEQTDDVCLIGVRI